MKASRWFLLATFLCLCVGCSRPPPTIEQCVDQLNGDSPDAAIDRLVEIGDPAVEHLDKIYEHLDERSRRFALRIFREVGSEKAVEALIRKLGADVSTQSLAKWELCVVGEDCVAQLVRALSAANARTRSRIVETLACIGGADALEALLGLYELEKDDGVIAHVLMCLRSFDDDTAMEILAREARSENIVHALYASDSLGRMKNPKSVVALAAILREDKRVLIKIRAAAGLARMNDSTGIEFLAERLHDGELAVRKASIDEVGRFKLVLFADLLVQYLEDEHAELRAASARSLQQIGDNRATPALIKVLHDDNTEVRKSAICALWEIGDLRALEDLLSVARADPDSKNRELALDAYLNISAREVEN